MTDYEKHYMFIVVFDDGKTKVYHAPSMDLLIEHLIQRNGYDDRYILSITRLPEDAYA